MTESLPPSQLEHPPALVFDASHMGALARVLRRQGRRWLLDLLNRAEPTPARLLFSEEMQVGKAHRLGRRVFRGRFKRRLLPRRIRLGRIQKRAVRGKVALPRWLRLHQQQLEHDLADPVLSIPDAYWPYAGRLAWQEPMFQRSLAEELNHWLSRCFLFDGEALPFPVFHANSFWSLYYVSSLQPDRFAWARRRFDQRAANALAKIARQEIMKPDWAGFWDQWLLCHVMVHHWELLGRDPALRTVLRVLPTAQWWAIAPQPPPDRRLKGLRRFLRWLGRFGKRWTVKNKSKNRPTKMIGGSHRKTGPNVAHPQWSESVPTDWLSLLNPQSPVHDLVEPILDEGAAHHV